MSERSETKVKHLQVQSLVQPHDAEGQGIKESSTQSQAVQPEASSDLVCVLCGLPWRRYMNRCECGGMCSWGTAQGASPDSWNVNADGSWTPKPPPKVATEDTE